MDLNRYVRKNILEMKAYSSARSEFKGEASVFLDANENPLRLTGYNRYPDPLQLQLKQKISAIKQIDTDKIFLGNGSDEPIDLVIRIFCEPLQDNIVAIDPTYGMYQVCANLNNVEYRKVLLDYDFRLNADRLLALVDENTKLVFLCSPNNPSGNILDRSEIEKIIKSFSGIVILDEAYIDFSIQNSWLPQLDNYPNLIILQTFSKAWALAAVRLGMAFASPELIQLFNKVKYPYNINQLTQEYVIAELDNAETKNEWINIILGQREWLVTELEKLNFVKKIYHSDSNFLLVKVADPKSIYKQLAEKGIIVRDRHTISLCEGCLRITVGTEPENKALIEVLHSI